MNREVLSNFFTFFVTSSFIGTSTSFKTRFCENRTILKIRQLLLFAFFLKLVGFLKHVHFLRRVQFFSRKNF